VFIFTVKLKKKAIIANKIDSNIHIIYKGTNDELSIAEIEGIKA
jgi:hypothetical protein